MKALEYQGKKIFAEYGLPVPEGIVINDKKEAFDAAKEIGGEVMVKAQVHTGGRSKAGGIQIAKNPAEAQKKAEEILGMYIKGYLVRQVYIEKKLDIEQEFYLGFTLDRASGMPVFIVSSEGGIDVEEVAEKHPERIKKVHVHPLWGLHVYKLRQAVLAAGIPGDAVKQVVQSSLVLYEVFLEEDAALAEINPAILTTDGKLFCGDSKLELDDNARFRHEELFASFYPDKQTSLELKAHEAGISFVELDGEIAVIGNGAGLVMSTLDSIMVEGGSAANFLDVGGGASALRMESAISIILEVPNIKSLLINIFGGITRCDEIAKGIVASIEKLQPDLPVIIRLGGTNEEEGLQILKDSSIDVDIYNYMHDATAQAVRAARRDNS